MVLNVVVGLMLLMGTTWFFQGIGVLPGSVMSRGLAAQMRVEFEGRVCRRVSDEPLLPLLREARRHEPI